METTIMKIGLDWNGKSINESTEKCNNSCSMCHVMLLSGWSFHFNICALVAQNGKPWTQSHFVWFAQEHAQKLGVLRNQCNGLDQLWAVWILLDPGHKANDLDPSQTVWTPLSNDWKFVHVSEFCTDPFVIWILQEENLYFVLKEHSLHMQIWQWHCTQHLTIFMAGICESVQKKLTQTFPDFFSNKKCSKQIHWHEWFDCQSDFWRLFKWWCFWLILQLVMQRSCQHKWFVFGNPFANSEFDTSALVVTRNIQNPHGVGVSAASLKQCVSQHKAQFFSFSNPHILHTKCHS